MAQYQGHRVKCDRAHGDIVLYYVYNTAEATHSFVYYVHMTYTVDYCVVCQISIDKLLKLPLKLLLKLPLKLLLKLPLKLLFTLISFLQLKI